MLKIATIAMIGAVSALGAVQAMTTLNWGDSGLSPRSTSMLGAQNIAKSADGHYWATARVNGIEVRFLVDTGATMVALTALDAQRLGFETRRLDYSQRVMTAQGETRAAPVILSSLSVTGARLTDVHAVVIEEGLDTSLLGMTYLGRLSRFEATPTALILRQ
jgi:aspartyl protease family protein